jgi:diguanylate cyclase (GGDEF)-like protein
MASVHRTGAFRWFFQREAIDAAVIFSTAILASAGTIRWNGFQWLSNAAAASADVRLDGFTVVLLFFSIALAIFGVRRVVDQRRERRRRKTAERHARSLELRDPLTFLPNRRHFEQELNTMLMAVGPSEPMPIVLLMDVIGFQAINDLHGYAGGDATLSQVAARLREAVGSTGLLARFGDDEFALCLTKADAALASRMAQAAIASLQTPVQIGLEEQLIGLTIGIGQASAEDPTVGETLRRAHVALYRARSMHVNFCFHNEKMDSHVRERSVLEKELRAAIGTSAIRPHYQPIIDLASTRVLSYEALARWTHPEMGSISPGAFVPLAEELGLIDDLTDQLFRTACRDALSWPAEVALSFNFTAGQLKDPNFADRVLAVLAETGLSHRRLEAEVTESALVDDVGAARRSVEKLRAHGIRIVLDDFGTGFSSLYHLKELRFDKLKIDRSFVQTIEDNTGSEIIVRAIIGLSNSLGLKVTAEGIETTEQAASMLERGADQGQGYLFGRPMSAGEARRLVAAFEQFDAAA